MLVTSVNVPRNVITARMYGRSGTGRIHCAAQRRIPGIKYNAARPMSGFHPSDGRTCGVPISRREWTSEAGIGGLGS